MRLEFDRRLQVPAVAADFAPDQTERRMTDDFAGRRTTVRGEERVEKQSVLNFSVITKKTF